MIAQRIGVSRSTVCREIHRNSVKVGKNKKIYKASIVQKKSEARLKSKNHHIGLTEEMKQLIRKEIIENDLSSEQISGRCKLEGIPMVSYETIYRWIWYLKKHGDKELSNHLRHNGCRYTKRSNAHKSRGTIQGRVGIEDRPSVVDQKNRFGDFEGDTIIGKNHKGAIMTLNDKETKIVFLQKLDSKEAKPLANAMIQTLSPYKSMIHTITVDNGKEFAKHKEISEALGIQVYFARPYHTWERGANETPMV